MYNLSELIKTDCCIDCGTNEKLREVVGKLNMPESDLQKDFGIESNDVVVVLSGNAYTTYSVKFFNPLTPINIDL